MRWVFVFAAFITATGGVQAADAVPFAEKKATAETIEQMRAGGLVLYMRHGPTDTSRPDRVPEVDLNDCSTQRPLTEAGRLVAQQVGEAIRRANIPIGEIQASPMCRCKETAAAAFGEGFVVNMHLMYTSNLTSEEKLPRIANTRRLLSTPVTAGSNRVIVAHAPNLMDVIGYFPKPEALVVVFRPLGEQGFEYIASIPPEQWQELLQ
jgi:phosphohistidine phosphatase SixA